MMAMALYLNMNIYIISYEKKNYPNSYEKYIFVV